MPDLVPQPRDRSQSPGDLWQVSLFRLFVGMSAFAAVLAAFFAAPPLVSAPLLLVIICALPAALLVFVIYARAFERAFCLGALFPAGLHFFVTAIWIGFTFYGMRTGRGGLDYLSGWRELCDLFMVFQRPFSITCWVSVCLVGLVTAGVWQSIEKRRK